MIRDPELVIWDIASTAPTVLAREEQICVSQAGKKHAFRRVVAIGKPYSVHCILQCEKMI